MRSPQLERTIRRMRTTLSILWAALFGSVGLYVVVAYVVAATADEKPAQISGELAIVLAVMAAAAAIAAVVVPPRILSDAKLRRHMTSDEFDPARYVTNRETGKVDQARLERLTALPAPEQRLFTLLNLYMAPWIVGMALAEMVAIFGFILSFLTHDVRYMLPFVGVAAGLMLLKRPDLHAFVRRAEQLVR